MTSKEKKHQYNQEVVAMAKRLGLCVLCRKQPAEPGKFICAKCSARQSRSCKALYWKRRETHHCVQCGKKLPEGYIKTRCEDCNEKHNECTHLKPRPPRFSTEEEKAARRVQEHARYEERKAAGLCATCGDRPPRPGKVICAACALKQRVKNMVMRKKRQAAHKCVRCSTPLPDDYTFLYCKACSQHVNELKKKRMAAQKEASA